MKKKILYEAFGLVREALIEKFGIVGYEFPLKKDHRVAMNVFTPKGDFSLGLIIFDITSKDKLVINTMDAMDRKPINRITDRITRKINKKYKGKK